MWELERKAVLVTNHIAGETWTFLRRRAGQRAAVAALAVFRSARVKLAHVDARQEAEAWKWLERHDERPYSFVDATSFSVMRSYRAREALSFDADFAAAGFVLVRA